MSVQVRANHGDIVRVYSTHTLPDHIPGRILIKNLQRDPHRRLCLSDSQHGPRQQKLPVWLAEPTV